MDIRVIGVLVLVAALGWTHYKAYQKGVTDEHNRALAEAAEKAGDARRAAAVTESESGGDRARARAVEDQLAAYLANPSAAADCLDADGMRFWASSAGRMSGGVHGDAAEGPAGAEKRKPRRRGDSG